MARRPWPTSESRRSPAACRWRRTPTFTRAFPGRQPTGVTVHLADGAELSEHADFHRGEAEHPHPPEVLRGKFLDLAAPVWGPERARSLYDRVLDLERVPDVAALAGDGL